MHKVHENENEQNGQEMHDSVGLESRSKIEASSAGSEHHFRYTVLGPVDTQTLVGCDTRFEGQDGDMIELVDDGDRKRDTGLDVQAE